MLRFLKTIALALGCFALHGQLAEASWVKPQIWLIPPNALRVWTGTPYPSNESYDNPAYGGGVYICRVAFQGGMHIGWVEAGNFDCWFGWGGQQQDSSDFEVWVDDWQPASHGNVPGNALAFGEEQRSLPYPELSIAKPRYPCQGTDPAGGLASGKVAPDIGVCDFPWGGRERSVASYNVLVDSALGSIDSAGGEKVPVSAMDPSIGFFVGNYEIVQSPGDSFLDHTIFSGYEAGGGPYLHLCSAYYLDGYHIGKTRAGMGGCDISYGGKELEGRNPYYVLVPLWVPETGGAVPIAQSVTGGNFLSGIIGGYEADGTHLYICMTETNSGAWVSGKVRPGLGGCDIGYGDQEQVFPTYYVLSEVYTSPIVVR